MRFAKFLSTFAAYTGAVKPVNKGPNDLIPYVVEHVLVQALVNTDTLDISTPAGYEDYIPQIVGIWSPAAPRIPQTNWGVTNHNRSTGITRLTATGAVANGSTVTIAYYPAT